MRSLIAFVARLRGERRGAAAAIFALTIFMTVGVTGFVLDYSGAVLAKRTMQAATDSAALAGAGAIPSGGGIAAARTFSALSGSNNANSNYSVTMVSGYPQLKCLTSTGTACVGTPASNAIVVKQQIDYPMTFARVLGINSWHMETTATAAIYGGKPVPVDVMIVLDTTASMNTANNSCSIGGATRLTCALAGGRALLSGMAPSSGQVGLMAFPGVKTTSDVAKQYDCATNTTPVIQKYSASPIYQLLGLGNDFRSSDTASNLNTASNIVRALKGGDVGCNSGLSAVGGVGTYYADAIDAAKSALDSNGRSGVQKAIVFISDGDANATSSNLASTKVTNQCQQAVSNAAAAKAAGYWVYSVAYGASTSKTTSCTTDKGKLSACDAMQQIASDTDKFFVGNDGTTTTCAAGAKSVTDLVTVFGSIAKSFQKARLIPDSTA